jgi:restriction system protein
MIPDYQSVMLPLLRLIEDGREYRIGDAVQKLGGEFGLSANELTEMLPSGGQALLVIGFIGPRPT